jgi:hypothetical protein
MKVIISVVIGICSIIFPTLTTTAWGFELHNVSIAQERREGEPIERILRINGDTGWDWLRLGLKGKFLLAPVEDVYSTCNIQLNSPEFCKNLVFDSSYDWNDKYKIYNGKINYSFSPLKTLRIKTAYQNEKRTPEKATGCPYLSNYESVALTWQQKPWKYSFNLARNDKDYYEDAQYTSLKYQFDQTLTWHPQTNVQLQVGYAENTGDYKTSSYKDFWKEEWIFNSTYKSKTKWRYEFEYRKLYWERGYELYRSSSKMQLKIGRKMNSTIQIAFNASFRDLDYFSGTPDYTEPGVYYMAEKDLKSRTESKAGLQLQIDYSNWTLEMGPFWGYTDYDSSSVKDTNRLGLYAVMSRSYHNFEFSLKLAPGGDFSTQNAYYQLEVAYKPRQKEAIKFE